MEEEVGRGRGKGGRVDLGRSFLLSLLHGRVKLCSSLGLSLSKRRGMMTRESLGGRKKFFPRKKRTPTKVQSDLSGKHFVRCLALFLLLVWRLKARSIDMTMRHVFGTVGTKAGDLVMIY